MFSASISFTLTRSSSVFASSARARLHLSTPTSRLFSVRGGESEPFPTWSFKTPCKTMEWSPMPKATVLVSAEDVAGVSGLKVIAAYGTEEDSEVDFVLPDGAEALAPTFEAFKEDFKNGTSAGSSLPVVTLSDSSRLTLVALGNDKEEKGTKAAAKKLASSVAGFAKSHKLTSVAISAPSDFITPLALKAFTTALYSEMYTDNRYKSGDDTKNPYER